MDQRLICVVKIMEFTNEDEVCGGNIREIAVVVKFAYRLSVFILLERATSLNHQVLYLVKL